MNQELLKTLVVYRKGKLYWKDSNKEAGSMGGTIRHPRCKLNIQGAFYYRYQLVYLYHTGNIPKYIDHINRNTLDDSIDNLREVTLYQNAHNTTAKEGTSTYKGVRFHKQRKKWTASIRTPQGRVSLGLYESELNAALSYLCMSKAIHGEYSSCYLPDILIDRKAVDITL